MSLMELDLGRIQAFDTQGGESALCSPFVNSEMTISGKQLFPSGSLSLSFVLVPAVGGSGLQTALPGGTKSTGRGP